MLRGYEPPAALSATSIFGHVTNYNLLGLPLFVMMGFFVCYVGNHPRPLLDRSVMARLLAGRAVPRLRVV
jgi:TRAP-type mannitol/chloroaromatic compound transport system permease large subunit